MKFLNPNRLDRVLIKEMEAYADYLYVHYPGSKIVVHEDFAGDGHATDSQHYTGRACDFHVEGVSTLEAWLALERFLKFGGIGLYPDWAPVPGFHADVRDTPYRARWARRGKLYVALDRSVLHDVVVKV